MAPDAKVKPRLPVVLIERPRCPYCASTRFKVRRSMPHDGHTGAVRRYCRCEACQKKFVVVAE
ncbi:MAG: hypothetical protein WD316_08575 [Phycisphaeraceae bacterium]